MQASPRGQGRRFVVRAVTALTFATLAAVAAGCGSTALLPDDSDGGSSGSKDLSATPRDLSGGGPIDLSGGGKLDLSTPSACKGPNPQGCATNGACPPDSICSMDPNAGCAPSACKCDPTTGSWICTSDCGGGVCVPVRPSMCVGANPQGCVNTGCPSGQTCSFNSGCAPTTCKCDVTTGAWSCSKDCGGGVCVGMPSMCPGQNPQGCAKTGCAKGYVCDTKAGCASSYCLCDPMSGQWVCNRDCNGGVCVPQAMACPGDNPQGCINTGCKAGYVCDTKSSCAPSACKCDTSVGKWVCSGDCGGGVCVPQAMMCSGPSPEGCIHTGCAAGEICDTKQGCFPSACKCDTTTGKWFCTADCGGGVCVKQTQITCPAPNPAGCLFNGCPSGQRCDTTVGCKSSYCKCDFSSGMWSCTNDCGGGTCVP